jgi:hypothetical protein
MICSRTSPIMRLRKIELAQMIEANAMFDWNRLKGGLGSYASTYFQPSCNWNTFRHK